MFCDLIQAMVYLDFECVEEVMEEAELTKKLSEEMKSKLISRLPETGNPAGEISKLFEEMDGDGSEALSRYEFQIFLESVHIVFSTKKWKRIFNEIDRDFDDLVREQ